MGSPLHQTALQRTTAELLAPLGVTYCEDANEVHGQKTEGRISPPGARFACTALLYSLTVYRPLYRIAVFVFKANEELHIAKQVGTFKCFSKYATNGLTKVTSLDQREKLQE